MFKTSEKIIVAILMVLGCLLVATSALASECPTLYIGNDQYTACPSNASICHYITPYYSTAQLAGKNVHAVHVWNGTNGLDSMNSACGELADYDGCSGGPDAYLHWVDNSNLLTISHGCAGPPPPTPTPTPTPPPPTPTPTPTPPPCVDEREPECTENTCGQTLTWESNCTTHTKTCPTCACVPETECGNRCGHISDGCNGTLDCGTCPVPTPAPNCDVCVYPTKYMAETGGFWLERLYFPDGGVVKLFVLEGTQEKTYNLVYWLGDADGNPNRNETLIHRVNGPAVVSIPVPSAGFPVPAGAYVEVYGGKSRITVYMQDPNTKVEVQHFNRVWTFVRR